MSKRSKRTTRNSKKASAKHSEQLFMTVLDHGATISVSNARNHFGYASFDLTITVKPSINDLEPQPLSVQLVFEDGQQIDMENNKNNIQFETKPSKLFIDKKGSCKFSVIINTYSMFHDNRAFKLIFNLSDNATRHIRPCETKPFRLVKHRLEIVTEPDDVFYKDEGGRANCLRCKILLKDSMRKTVKNRDIPLIAKLVYEDMSVAQSSRDILEILTQNVQLKHGQCGVDFRINEVSKNHNKRAFRVLYECKSNDALYHDISSCVTNKIMVKSKRTKKKGSANSKGRRGQNKKKRKREIKKKQSPPTSSSDLSLDGRDLDSDDNINTEPLRKKQRRSRGYNNPYSHNFNPHLSSTLPSSVLNGDNDPTQYVPPALTGILPSIRPGALPRIGHQPPPFVNFSKKNPMLKQEKNGMGGGVLGHMFAWCKLAGWVMNRLEWTHCGYEYDEATHSIDTRRPLYRCSYCLKYRNEAGWGQHEQWCQLSLALKEYENKVKTLYREWNYQMNNKGVDVNGGMTTLDHQSSSPPPNNSHSKDKNDAIPAPFGANTNNAPPPPALTTPFLVTPNQSNGIWSFNNHHFGANNALYPAPHHHHPHHHHHHQTSPQFTGFLPPTNNNDGAAAFDLSHNQNPAAHADKSNNECGGNVKHELFANNNENNMTLPCNMTKISSVSRVRSQHGYDAYDKDNNFVGIFDDEGTFYDAEQFNDQYQPTFDHTNMLWRNQSDDYLFYNHLRNNIFDKT